MRSPFSGVPVGIAALKRGQFVIVVDDADRENEGDLIIAAEKVTEKQMAFLIRHTSGIIFLALSNAIADHLHLPPMVARNTSKYGTPFTVTIEAAEGVSTGVSAHDRVRTVRIAMDKRAQSNDLRRPGHIFPLRAQDGGVLVRAGHTEASVDLMKLAGLRAGAVGAELMNDDGTMMRLPALMTFAKNERVPILRIGDLIAHRRRTESLIKRQARSRLETRYGQFEISVYVDILHHKDHIALRMGKVTPGKPVLVRVHSECITGDVFGSHHCDCGEQLDIALQRIAAEGTGVLVYLRQEGRGIGLANKIRAYELQHLGMDTVEANRSLGLPDDPREYGICAQILKDLGVGTMRLLTNNPKKVIGLEGYELKITEQIPIEIAPTSAKQRTYLKSKKEKMGHRLRGV